MCLDQMEVKLEDAWSTLNTLEPRNLIGHTDSQLSFLACYNGNHIAMLSSDQLFTSFD